jgi:hypothetical protein
MSIFTNKVEKIEIRKPFQEADPCLSPSFPCKSKKGINDFESALKE